MIGFKERLRTELVELVEERRAETSPRRHRASRLAWRLAVPIGVTAAVVVGALAVGSPRHTPDEPTPIPMVVDEVGYSIEVKPDGIVEIALDDPAGAKGLERKLNELGFRAVVLIDDPGCQEPKPEMAVHASTILDGFGDHGETRFRRSALPADAYLLIVHKDAEDQYPNDGPGMTMIMAVKTAPTCFKITLPADFPTPSWS